MELRVPCRARRAAACPVVCSSADVRRRRTKTLTQHRQQRRIPTDAGRTTRDPLGGRYTEWPDAVTSSVRRVRRCLPTWRRTSTGSERRSTATRTRRRPVRRRRACVARNVRDLAHRSLHRRLRTAEDRSDGPQTRYLLCQIVGTLTSEVLRRAGTGGVGWRRSRGGSRCATANLT